MNHSLVLFGVPALTIGLSLALNVPEPDRQMVFDLLGGVGIVSALLFLCHCSWVVLLHKRGLLADIQPLMQGVVYGAIGAWTTFVLAFVAMVFLIVMPAANAVGLGVATGLGVMVLWEATMALCPVFWLDADFDFRRVQKARRGESDVTTLNH